jgi:hypothetical protein
MNLFLLVYSYTEWRRLGLPSPNLRELADEANRISADLAASRAQPKPTV